MADQMALLVADVYELAGQFRRLGEVAAAGEGQTQARWQLLSVISDNPLTVPQAARRLGVSRQGVQRVVNVLVGEGLVETRPNPDHRTSPLIALTARGSAVLQAITDRAAAMNRRLSDALEPAVMRATRDGVGHLIRALRNYPAADS